MKLICETYYTSSDVIVFEIAAHHFPHCCFLWAFVFSCHNKTSKLSNSILHQFGGLHKLWDSPTESPRPCFNFLCLFLFPIALRYGTSERFVHCGWQLRGIFVKLNFSFCRRLDFIQLLLRRSLTVLNCKSSGHNRASFHSPLPILQKSTGYFLHAP